MGRHIEQISVSRKMGFVTQGEGSYICGKREDCSKSQGIVVISVN